MRRSALLPTRLFLPGFLVFASTVSVDALRYGNLEIDVKGAVGGTYDDNIAFSNRNRKKDCITNLIAGLGARYEGKLRTLAMGANVTHHLFAEHSELNNTSQDLAVDFRNEFSKYDGFTFRNVFAHAEEPRSFEDALGRSAGRYAFYRNRLAFEYYRDVSRHVRLLGRYGHEFDKLLRADLRDSYLHRVGAGAEYAFSSRLSVLSSYEFANRRFQPGREASSHGLTGGIRHALTPRLELEARGGANLIRSFDAREHVRPSLFASLTSDIDRNNRARLSYTRETFANPYSEDLFSYWQMAATYVRAVSRRLDASVSGFYGEGEYPQAPLTDQLWGGTVSLTYALLQHLRGTLSYAHSSVDSTRADRNYDRNAVFLGILMEY